MKDMKKWICGLVMASLCAAASAQTTVEEIEVPVDRYRVITNTFWDNWFVNAAGGAQVLFGDDTGQLSFGDRIAPALQFGVGKWFTPGLGLRLQYSGLKAKGYERNWSYMNLHADVLFNVSQMVMGYNEQRVYNLIPYAGFGWAHAFKSPHTNVFTLNFGLLQTFRLCSALDLQWELFGMAAENRFDRRTTHRGLDVMLGTTVGLAWKFPRRGFQHAPDVNALVGLTAAQTAAINEALAQQIAQNNQLRAQLNQQAIPVVAEEVVVSQPVPIPQSVFFAIGSAQLPPTAEVNLHSIAQFAQQNPGVTLQIQGYADSDTGSAAWNEQLSRQRAQAVAQALEHLGVPAAQLSVSGQGGVDTLTPPAFNRRVIISAL
jgi:outer membrane protein OmpA-like peptidoglycan-associated protein